MPAPSGRAKRICVPSGEYRGESSGPEVSGASPSPLTCFSQIRGWPSRSEVNATVWPSGDTAGEESRPEKLIQRKTAAPFASVGCARDQASMAPPARAAPARTRKSRSRRRPRPAGRSPDGSRASVVRLRVEEVEIASSAMARSCALRKRSSGRFSRQQRTMRSSAGETLRVDSKRLGGSSLRMALRVSTGLSPRKALLPVSIS